MSGQTRRSLCEEALLKIRGVISFTFQMAVKRCVVRIRSDLKAEVSVSPDAGNHLGGNTTFFSSWRIVFKRTRDFQSVIKFEQVWIISLMVKMKVMFSHILQTSTLFSPYDDLIPQSLLLQYSTCRFTPFTLLAIDTSVSI